MVLICISTLVITMIGLAQSQIKSCKDPSVFCIFLPISGHKFKAGVITPTPTATGTSSVTTPTPTETNTPTTTYTSTITPSHTPTTTHTPTGTPSTTPTTTSTPTPTYTSTVTPSYTPTGTSTETSTSTPTDTPTSSPTVTLTPTATPTDTNTPTSTPTSTDIPGPDFSMSITPVTHYVTPGQSVVFTVTLTSMDEFTDPVWLSVSGLPAGATESWNVNPITPTASSELTISTSDDTLIGIYSLTVNGTGGGKSHDVQATLVVKPDNLPIVDHCGSITTDETWQGGFVHRITCNVTINAGVTLTVVEHAIVKFSPGISINVYGTLVAQGSQYYPAYFTSIKDDTVGGDTNNDGNASQPAKGDWRYIQVIPSGSVDINHAIIRFGGYYNSYNGAMYGAIYGMGGTITINNSIFDQNQYGIESTSLGLASISNTTITNSGIGVFGSGSFTVSNCLITNNSYGFQANEGILIVTNSSIQNNILKGVICTRCSLNLLDNIILDNGTNGLDITYPIPNDVITATNNIISGHEYPIYVTVESGHLNLPMDWITPNTIVDNRYQALHINGTLTEDSTFSPTSNLTYYIGKLSVSSSAHLTVSPGTVIKVDNSMYESWSISGDLMVQGTENDPVFFTSIKDDTVGGDTNNDGNASQPAKGDWRYIQVIPSGSVDINHAIIRFGGYYNSYNGAMYGAIYGMGGTITINNSIFDQNQYGIESTSLGLASISNTTITNSGIGVFGSGSFTVSNCLITNNSYGFQANEGILIVTNSSIQNNILKGVICTRCSLNLLDNIILDNGTNGLDITYPIPNDVITATNNIISGHEYPIYVTVESGHLNLPMDWITPNTIVDNRYQALHINGTLTEDSTFSPTSNLTYYIGKLSVSSSAHLTVSPGTVIKVDNSMYEVLVN